MSPNPFDWTTLMPEVARRLLREPNPQLSKESRGELRYRQRGSLVVYVGGPRAGTWHDFEANEGGGVLALVERELGCDRAAALEWLTDEGLIDPKSPTLQRRDRIQRRQSGPVRARRQLPEGRTQSNFEAPSRPAYGGAQKPASKTAPLVEPILATTVPADDTPARVYLARRRTWPPLRIGPDLPDSVRWLPREAAPAGVKLPPAAVGALVFLLTRPDTGQAPAVKLEALSSKGERVGWSYESRWRPNYGPAQGCVFEPTNRPGGLLWLLEGECDALALMICGYGGLVRSVGSASNLRLATVTDREQRAVVLVADGDPKGRVAAWKLHDEIAAIGPEREPRVHEFDTGDPAELLADLLTGSDWAELLAAAARGDDLLNLLPSGPQA